MTRKYIIVDDEHIAHDIIKKYCDMLPNMILMQNCYDAIEAIEYLNVHAVDLIFLDLNMPKLKGFEFLKTLTNPPKVIVTTAYKEYALEGYELNIVDYLLKPFSFERFLKAVNKAFSGSKDTLSTAVSQKINSDEKGESIFVSSNKKHIQVQLNDILYVEASGNYTKIVLQNETITIREKLSNVIERLPESGFLQVHRSFVVAIRWIKSIEGNQIKFDKYTVPIGKIYKSRVIGILK